VKGYLVYCVFVVLSFFCHFCHVVCMVTDFSAAEKAGGVKFCTRVGLLSHPDRSSFLVNIGSRGVTGTAALLPG